MKESTNQGELEIVGPLSCDLSVLSQEQRRRQSDLVSFVVNSNLSVRESASGYEFIFKSEPEVFLKLSEWILLERLCCPFFSFAIAYDSDGPIRLGITSPGGVKEVLKSAYTTKT